MEMWGKDEPTLAMALGFAHGLDRMMQLMLVRLFGQGRLTECLENNKENLEWDRLFRHLRLAADAAEDVANLSPEAGVVINSYCRGLNHCLKKYGYPWEFRLVGYRPNPWAPADCLLTSKVMSYVALGDSQEAMEKFIARSIKSGVEPERLRKIAPAFFRLTLHLKVSQHQLG